jgi:hypothetical protein
MTTFRVARALLAMIGMIIGVLVMTTPAQAAKCPYYDKEANKIVYCNAEGGGGQDDGGGGDGGSQEPTCDLSNEPYTEFCKGTLACWGNNPAGNSEEDVADELPPKPGDDYHVAYRNCEDGSDTWYWSKDGEGPSIEELAQIAFGELVFPEYTLTFNPPRRTYVNLDTWWWAQGATTEELIGTAALGVRALATPNRMEVDPGDGSGVFSCEFVTAKSDDCTYTYRRASVRGSAAADDGSPAYPARMRLVYDVRFEVDGTPLTLDDLPTSFSSPWQDQPVPVREIQTVVRPRS